MWECYTQPLRYIGMHFGDSKSYSLPLVCLLLWLVCVLFMILLYRLKNTTL